MTMRNAEGGRIPQLTIGWRMRIALETSDISVNEMALRLGYSRSTISRWLNDQDEPRPVILDVWAQDTDVNRRWLETGEGSPSPGPSGGEKRPDQVALARLAAKKRRHAVGGTNPGYDRAA